MKVGCRKPSAQLDFVEAKKICGALRLHWIKPTETVMYVLFYLLELK